MILCVTNETRYEGNLNAHKTSLLKVPRNTWHNKTVITSKHMLPKGRHSSTEPCHFRNKTRHEDFTGRSGEYRWRLEILTSKLVK